MLSDLTNLSATTLKDLELLWSEIGLDDEERNAYTTALFHDVKVLCENKVAEAQAQKQALITEAEHLAQKTAAIYIEIGGEDKPSRPSYVTATLKENLNQQRKGLEEAELRRMERVGQMKIAYDKIKMMFLEMENELGEEHLEFLGPSADSDLRHQRLHKFNARLELLHQEQANRVATIEHEVQKIWQLWNLLGMTKEEACINPIESKVWAGCVAELGTRDSTMKALVNTEARLASEKQMRTEKIASMQNQIRHLWDLLDVPSEERDEVVEHFSGISSSAIQKCVDELARLSALKEVKMSQLVAETRDKLAAVWADMRMTPSQMQAFAPFSSQTQNEDTLQQCRGELERATSLLQTMQPMLKLVAKREKVKSDAAELEASAQDSDRLLGRSGSKRDPGRLLREEKVRNMVAKELPKIEEALRRTITEWELAQGVTFEVDGVSYLSVMEEETAAARAHKEEERLRKEREKQRLAGESADTSTPLRTPRGKTPVSGAVGSATRAGAPGSASKPSSASRTRKPKAATPSSGAKRPLGNSTAVNVVAIDRVEVPSTKPETAASVADAEGKRARLS